MSSVYFGGSRNLPKSPAVGRFVAAVLASGQSVHVGCQFGADLQVSQACPAGSLSVFAVAGSLAAAPTHVQQAARKGARVVLSAGGGSSIPIKARYLLRSKAAFQGCSAAVFFAPGAGSLAVARECVKAGIPVFVIWLQSQPPAPIPSTPGQWVQSSFFGLGCWQFRPAAVSLF